METTPIYHVVNEISKVSFDKGRVHPGNLPGGPIWEVGLLGLEGRMS